MKNETKYRFDTIREMNEWRKNHIPGLYKDGLYLGCCREEMELWNEANRLGISYEDLYDINNGILRFDI
jgi:hypothetical protein